MQSQALRQFLQTQPKSRRPSPLDLSEGDERSFRLGQVHAKLQSANLTYFSNGSSRGPVNSASATALLKNAGLRCADPHSELRALRSLPPAAAPHLITPCWRIADARAFEYFKRFRDAVPACARCEIFFRAQRGQFLGHRDVDELVQCHALCFGHLTGLVKKRRLKP